MLDPDVRRQLREVAEAATEVFPNVDRVFAGIFDPPTVLSLLDALDEADLLRRNFNTLGDVNRELAAERDALAEALAVTVEALRSVRIRTRNTPAAIDEFVRLSLARIDTLTAQGEPT